MTFLHRRAVCYVWSNQTSEWYAEYGFSGVWQPVYTTYRYQSRYRYWSGTFGYTVDQVSLFVAHIKWIKIVMLFVPYICTGSCKLCIYLYHTLFKYLRKLCEIVVLRKCHYTSLASRLYGGRASFLLHASLPHVDVINWDSPASEGADHFYKKIHYM